GPGEGAVEERAADAAASVSGGDHQAEVGDMRAGGVRVAREREPPDELAVHLGDEDGRVRRAAHGTEIAAFFRNVPPVAVGDQPALGLAADGPAELDERRRVRGPGAADDEVTQRRSRARAG